MSTQRKGNPKGRRRSRRAARRLRSFLVVAAALAGIAGVTVYAMSNREPGISAEQVSAAKGTLIAETTFHDFGQISMKDGVVTYPFRLKNTGSAPALIRKIFTS